MVDVVTSVSQGRSVQTLVGRHDVVLSGAAGTGPTVLQGQA